jgi:NADPH:quinone reductase-like Zn-dependent oxidoreductase
MKAMVLVGHGGADQYDYRDVPTPRPGPDEVLVAVDACSVNNTDINVRTDWYEGEVDESGLTLPRIQGADVAGRIVAVGAAVDEARVGERVVVDPHLRSGAQRLSERSFATDFLGFDVDGGYAQFVAVPAANAWKVPDQLPAAELACFPVAYSTALEMILRARPRPGQTMVVTGASGGLGSALIQLARVFRLEVIASASGTKAERLVALGAHLVIDRDQGPTVQGLKAAGVDQIDIVADVVGRETLADLLALVRPGGHAVTAGAVSGPIAPIDLRHLIYQDIDLRGVSRPGISTFATLVDLISTGELRPPVAATFPLSELVAAQDAFLARGHVGKVVVTVDHDPAEV